MILIKDARTLVQTVKELARPYTQMALSKKSLNRDQIELAQQALDTYLEAIDYLSPVSRMN